MPTNINVYIYCPLLTDWLMHRHYEHYVHFALLDKKIHLAAVSYSYAQKPYVKPTIWMNVVSRQIPKLSFKYSYLL